MERPNFVENGGFKLPIGYRFHPTDEELVVHYLKRKVLGLPMPASVIPEFDVFQNDPSSLPGSATGPKTTQMEEVGDWVAYSVFQRKRKPRKNVVVSNPSNINETRNIEIISPSFMDFMMEQSSDGVGPPSPCSSGVTEVSPNEVDQEEISSSSISLFSYPCNRKRT
uniref:NAC domain-containing protein n=1 Tax=Populus alba TaxID=43335 RepID=A0A4V6A4A7_POPAL|nr:hypothetical protein D5086_0000238830 [Populus alba]